MLLKQIDKYVLEVTYVASGKKYEVKITENERLATPPIIFGDEFWKKDRCLDRIVRELSELGIKNFDKKQFGIELDEAHTKFSELSVDKRSLWQVADVSCEPHLIIKNPSIGLCSFTMFTMFNVPYDENGQIKYAPWLIFSDKKKIPLTPESMTENHIYPVFIPNLTENRWSAESVDYFCDPETNIKAETFSKLMKIISNIFKEYLEFHDGEAVYKFMSLWTLGTYFQHIFKAYPYVYLHGIKASGKTKCLDVVQQLAFNAVNTANMSSSSLFRIIQSTSATVLIDEGEGLNTKERKEAFRELLLSGYKKGTKTFRVEEAVINNVKTYIVKDFNLFSPKMIANISGIEDVLESRCTLIHMRPASNQAIANREINEEEEVWQITRDKMYLFMMSCWKDIKGIYDKVILNDGFFKNREWERWKPILTMSFFFSCYDEILGFAKKIVIEERKQEKETNESLVMQILLDSVETEGWIPIKQILDDVSESLGYTWEESTPTKDGFKIEKKGRLPQWLNAKYIGNVLRRLGFKERRRVGKGYEVNLKKKEIEDQAIRMNLIEEPSKDAEKWLQENLPSDSSVSVILLEETFRKRFGDEAVDSFWDAYSLLKQDGVILELELDKAIKVVKEVKS